MGSIVYFEAAVYRFNWTVMKNALSKICFSMKPFLSQSLLYRVISVQLTLKSNSILINSFHLLVRNGKILSTEQIYTLCTCFCWKMQPQNITYIIIRPEDGEEPERLSNNTNLIIFVRTQMWPHLNVDSDASVHTNRTRALPLQPSFENNLITRN